MLGERYVREKDDEIIILRIIKIKNENDVVVKDDNGNVFPTTMNVLKTKYSLLNPDGFLSFNIVYIDGGLNGRFDDVIITLHTRKDMESESKIPTVICRQNINDLHAAQLKIERQGTNKDFYGMSISRETCPEDVKFETILSCDGLVKSVPVAVYVDDTFEDIMSVIKVKEFDKILESIFVDHVRRECNNNQSSGLIYNKMINLPTIDGFVKTLRELLVMNNFMYDFYRTFDIIPLKDINISIDMNKTEDTALLIRVLESFLNVKFTSFQMIRFGKDINLSRLAYSYQLIANEKEEVYLVLYTHEPRDIDDITAEMEAKVSYKYLNACYNKYL